MEGKAQSLEFAEMRLTAFEHELNKINSRLSSFVDRLAAELEEIKGLSDSISTLYEMLERYVDTE